MALKDSKLEEKEQLIIKGTIFADEFRDRKTGKEIGGDSGGYSKSEVDTLLNGKSNATKMENGTGTNAIQEKMANDTVNFAGRNPNAIALDPTLAAQIPTGASGNQSAAFGKDTMALATASFSNGNKALAKGEESHAEGYCSVTLGDGSHAEGGTTVAYGSRSHSEGNDTQAIGDDSHAEGHNTIAGGVSSHSEGVDTKIGSYEQPEGIGANQSSGGGGGGGGGDTPPSPGTFTAGEGSHSEGYSNVVVASGSHAEGLRNFIAGEGSYSHVEGVNNTNSGEYAIVSGYNNINSGACSSVYGVWNNNSGYGSFIAGHHNKNTHDNKSVFGRYNEDKNDTIFEVGYGTADNDRKNAIEVKSNGDVNIPHLVGGGTKLYVHRFNLGGTPLISLIIISTKSDPYLNSATTLSMLYMNVISVSSLVEKIVNIYYADATIRYVATVEPTKIVYMSSTISTYGDGNTAVDIDTVTAL